MEGFSEDGPRPPLTVRHAVPFLRNEGMDCGPAALAMALSFVGRETPVGRIKALADPEQSGVTWTLGLAAAAGEIGASTHMYTTSLGLNMATLNLDYYVEHAGDPASVQAKLTGLISRCIRAGVKLTERSVPLSDLRYWCSRGQIAVVLLDWGTVKGSHRYTGHFVPMVGYTGDSVIIHNPGPDDATPFMELPVALFEAARRAAGTDEDLLIIEERAR